MSYSKRLSREKRREQLLSIATDVFARRGFHPTSMDDIAEAAGVSKPVLYQHFTSKDELFDIVTERAITDLQVRISDVLENVHDRQERVYSTFKAYFDFVQEHKSAYLLLTRHSSGTSVSTSRWRTAVDGYVAAIAASIVERQGVSLLEAEVISRAIVGMAERVAESYISNPELNMDAVGVLTARLAFTGLQSITGTVVDLRAER